MEQAYLNWRDGDVFNLEDIFDDFKDKNLEIEIGCGKGKFLVGRAQENPDINFIGIDWAGKFMKIGAQRAHKRDLKNIVFVRAHAEDLLKHIMPQKELSIIHMYFPDPWPKKRHHKRRLFRDEFVDLVHEALTEDGRFEIATDFSKYYDVMLEAIAEAKIKWPSMQTTENDRIFDPHLKTNYELKYEVEGRTLHYIELKK